MKIDQSYPPTPATVRQLREACGMTTLDLADYVGVSRRQAQRWEQPTSNASHRYPSRPAWRVMLTLTTVGGTLAKELSHD